MSYIVWLILACAKKPPETAKSPAEDLGNGASRLENVLFEGVQKIDEAEQEASLDAVESKTEEDGGEEVKEGFEPNGLKTLSNVEELVQEFTAFSNYEYGEDDEKNAEYLLGEKLDVFHQITGSAYKIVVAERNYYEVSAGIYVAGAAELRYAEMWKRYPTPETLDIDPDKNENAKIVFGERVRDTVKDLGVEGRDKLERLISHYYRSGISGEYTEAALQELKWRFPLDYPDPVVPTDEDSQLLIFKTYTEFMEKSAVNIPSSWPSDYEARIQLTQRLEDKRALIDEVNLACGEQAEKFSLLGQGATDFCVLRTFGEYDVLYTRYPVKLTKELADVQKAVQEQITTLLGKVEQYSDSEYHRFWRKEIGLLLREYQYTKVQALREKQSSGFVPDLDMSLWEYTDEEEIEKSVADILDAHVKQLERVSKILRYDVHHLSDDRSQVTRQMFIEIPEQLQDMEFSSQAVLYAFPEQPEVRTRILLSLGESYAHYVYVLNKMEVSGDNGQKIITQAVDVYRPIAEELLTIVVENGPTEEYKQLAAEAIDVLNMKYTPPVEEPSEEE